MIIIMASSDMAGDLIIQGHGLLVRMIASITTVTSVKSDIRSHTRAGSLAFTVQILEMEVIC